LKWEAGSFKITRSNNWSRANYFVIKNGGNVGLWTASPVYTLDVNGSARIVNSLNVWYGIFWDFANIATNVNIWAKLSVWTKIIANESIKMWRDIDGTCEQGEIQYDGSCFWWCIANPSWWSKWEALHTCLASSCWVNHNGNFASLVQSNSSNCANWFSATSFLDNNIINWKKNWTRKCWTNDCYANESIPGACSTTKYSCLYWQIAFWQYCLQDFIQPSPISSSWYRHHEYNWECPSYNMTAWDSTTCQIIDNTSPEDQSCQ